MIFARNIAGHVANPALLMKNIHRALKPGGSCFINELVFRGLSKQETLTIARMLNKPIGKMGDERDYVPVIGFALNTYPPVPLIQNILHYLKDTENLELPLTYTGCLNNKAEYEYSPAGGNIDALFAAPNL